MKNIKSNPLLILMASCLFFYPKSIYAQCNGAPCINPNPVADPADACILSDQNDLTCYEGATTMDPAVVFPNWCGSNQNTQWFAFTATATTAVFALVVPSCSQGNALQGAVFSSGDCINFSLVSNCVNVLAGQGNSIMANGLVPGQVYYLCIGGNNGAICDYQIDPGGWAGATVVCVLDPPLSYSTAATDAIWSVDPPSAASFDTTEGPVVHITFLEPGTLNLCINSSHCPEYCGEIEVHGGEFEEYVDLCEGKSVECAGHTYTSPGVFDVSEPDGPDCFKTIHCHVNLIPTAHSADTVFMCQNSSVTCAGEEFFSPGTYPVTLQGPNGCDSVVTCKVQILPPSPVTNLTINLCGPAEYGVCNSTYNASGTYTEICTNYLGCDSIINLDLAVLEPHAVINPPDTLTCQVDTITLDGSNSSINNANVGITLYNWTGPGIVGSSTMPTVKINQSGSYCLVVTHRRGAVSCTDTTCVVVAQTSSVPALPQLLGNNYPCQDSTYLYTAMANGNPAPSAFDWTLPGNISYTTLSPDSILVTWDSLLIDSLCVIATNTCGVSQPACYPIVVQTPVEQPLMSGPGSVCADSTAYEFTLNLEQTGVEYIWTTPPGAILTGVGDTVHINFQNAVSGQVCVTPQNACGAGLPVCLDVEANPIPTADLSGDAEICAGESIDLSFSLNGNGPFDVSWSVNGQNFTLNDISNGHIESVSPTQTTIYKITSISDNTAAVCAATLLDSVTVTVWQAANTPLAAQICSGESLFVGGSLQSSSGIYSDTLQTIHGCDSVLVTTLTVLVIDTTMLAAGTCDPALAGTSTQILPQQNGCDSVVITVTALLPSDSTLIAESSCDVNEVGVLTQNLSNQYGCDSTVVTTVTFTLGDTTMVAATTCDSTAAGVFYNNLMGLDGCDSLIITTVSLLPSNTTMLTGTSCNPAEVGVFTNVLSNRYGCDSTVITTVSFVQLPTTFLTATSCDPNSTGVFTDHITTAGGCDSVVVTTVSLLPSDTTMLTGSSCNPADVGVFTNVLSNQYGCDSTIITTVTLVPLPTTFLTTTSCDPNSTGVFTDHITTAGGCDSLVVTTVSLLPSDTTMLLGASCDTADVGVFTNILSNQYSCDSTIITTVTLLPSDQTSIATTTCDPAMAGVFIHPFINQYGCDSIVTETRTLLPSSMSTINLTTCDPTQVGSTTDIVPNQFGCDSTIVTITSLLPANSCSVVATVEGSDIPCASNIGTLTLTPTVGTAPFSYTVMQGATVVTNGTITTLGTPQVVGGIPEGTYTVTISSPNGFSTTEQATVIQLFPPDLTSLVNSNYSGFDLSCAGSTDGSALATASGGLPPYTFSWSNGGNTQQINNLSAGAYTVTVMDANSCLNVSTVVLTEPDPLEISFIVNDLDCFGEHDGAIQVEVTGGAAPYQYSLNNEPVQDENIFSGLDPGVYSITASDANDCQQTDVIVVNAATLLSVDLGDDVNISLGDSTTLQATVNVPIDSILSVVWSPPMPDSMECVPSPCLTQVVTPFISTVYTIQVQALNGCTAQDHVRVNVDRHRDIYVPNVFSPNGDGANDLFTIYARPGSVSKILSLQVFDRWGEAIITLKDFQPNSPTVGWDGSNKGQPMNPAVFVWVAEIEFIDGHREVFKGDVTVLR